MAARCAPPFAACSAMFAVAVATRHVVLQMGPVQPGLVLAAQVGMGATTYVPAALLMARSTSLDMIGLFQRALRERAVRHAPS
jgi:hypothetical protein